MMTDAGEYKFIVGDSSDNEKVRLNVSVVKGSEVKTNDVLKLKEPLNVLKKVISNI